MDSVHSKPITRWQRGAAPLNLPDDLAVEEPLEIVVNGEPLAITMRTPGGAAAPNSDRELALGWLLSEGVIAPSVEVQIEFVAPAVERSDKAQSNTANRVALHLDGSQDFDVTRLSRHQITSSSCGLCGARSIEAVEKNFAPLEQCDGPTTARTPGDLERTKPAWPIDAEQLTRLDEQLRRRQAVFSQTGGLHAAALFDESGKLIVLREDVGRHNAVDKLLGWAWLNDRLPLSRQLMMVSGRVSFEIMQKALAGGLSMVVAVSAPSSLAVAFAERQNQTLVGFLRGDGFNVYAHPERIQFSKPSGIC